mmetsp:Transcript_19254/g.55887  ORF Transcript_19254/g.55887 Transcript_19254/m.55887 type:complete len:232 (+) Transcript_19254:1553-2248(+)
MPGGFLNRNCTPVSYLVKHDVLTLNVQSRWKSSQSRRYTIVTVAMTYARLVAGACQMTPAANTRLRHQCSVFLTSKGTRRRSAARPIGPATRAQATQATRPVRPVWWPQRKSSRRSCAHRARWKMLWSQASAWMQWPAKMCRPCCASKAVQSESQLSESTRSQIRHLLMNTKIRHGYMAYAVSRLTTRSMRLVWLSVQMVSRTHRKPASRSIWFHTRAMPSTATATITSTS